MQRLDLHARQKPPRLPRAIPWASPRPRLLALAGVALLAACGAPGHPDEARSWFPLAAGHEWKYRVTTTRDDADPDQETLVLRTLGQDAVDGAEAWRRRSDAGMDYWLRRDETGIYRVASKSDLQAEPDLDAERRYVLRAPYTVGTSWRASTTTYLLLRRHEFPRELRHLYPSFSMQYTIEAVDEVVEAPAGRFEGCLRVRGDATLRLYADPVVGWRDVPLWTLEWYCPGVGLARLERHEDSLASFISGGALTMELTAWR